MKISRIHKRTNVRLGAAALCLALAFGQAGGLLTPGALAAAAPAKETLTLEQVRDMARSRGSETLKAKADLAIAQASMEAADVAVGDAWYSIQSGYSMLTAAQKAQEDAVNNPAPPPSLTNPDFGGVLSGLLTQITAATEIATASQMIAIAEGTLIAAEMKLEDAQFGLDDAKATVESQMETAIYTGEELFFTYLQLNDALAMMDKTIALSKDQIKIEELKAKLGMTTDTEVQKKQLSLTELSDRRQSLVNAIDLTGRSLMRQIGKAEDTPFSLDPSFSVEGLKATYDPDEMAVLTVKNNLMLKTLDRAIDKLKDALNLDFTYTQKNQYAAQADSLILSRDNAILGMKILARTTASGLETAKTELSLLEKKIAEKQVAYDVMALQVTLGLAPKMGLAAVELDLYSAQNDLKKARQDYYLSLRKAALLVKGVAITSAGAGR